MPQMLAYVWNGDHTWIGVAMTMNEAREQVIARIRKYHFAPEGNEYSARHEQQVAGAPDEILDLPCGFMVVNYE